MITLANGSQTMAKGISSACPFPSIPLTSILYVPDSPFNLISISKLTRDLNCFFFFLMDKQIYKKPKEGTRAPSGIQGVYREEPTAKPKEK